MRAHSFIGACRIGASGLLFCGAAIAAPPLPDPTRPATFTEPAAASAAPRRSETALTSAPAAPQLQSVQLAANGGSSALLDGRLVRVGTRVGEFTVVAIDEQGLWLRGARQERRLSLLPGVTKLASGTAPITPRPALHVATAKETP